MQLATLSALKAMLQITVATDDAALNDALSRASAAVESYCGRSFGRATVTEALDCRNGDRPVLRRYPVISMASLTMGGTVQPLANYTVSSAGALRLADVSGPLPAGDAYFLVQYTGGYILPGDAGADLPDDIQQATLLAAAANYMGGNRDPMLRSQSAEGVGSESYVANNEVASMPSQAASLLAPWRMVG